MAVVGVGGDREFGKPCREVGIAPKGDERMRWLTEIRCALIGYGGAFNMGKHHAEMMERTGVMKVVAVCDADPQRLEAAKLELPNINTYISIDSLLEKEDFDLAVIITPHNTHPPLAVTIFCTDVFLEVG